MPKDSENLFLIAGCVSGFTIKQVSSGLIEENERRDATLSTTGETGSGAFCATEARTHDSVTNGECPLLSRHPQG